MVKAGQTLEELEQFLSERNLSGTGLSRGRPWGSGGGPPGGSPTVSHWKWDDIYAGLMASSQLVTVGPGAMVGMRTVSPQRAQASPITMGAQILMPGERTQAHRNMKNETRLVWEAPAEAFFVCEYEAFPMRRGDVVISPTWTYHDHWNRGDQPAIWVECFDWGYVGMGEQRTLDEWFPPESPYQEIKRPEGYAVSTLGHARRLSDQPVYPLLPMRYPWSETEIALRALQESETEGDPCEGLHLMFASPLDGGPTLPTMAWHVQLLTGRQKTLAHRHNSTTCYQAFEGEGATVVEGEPIEWRKGDLFAIPPWKWHHHENTSTNDAILFSADDWPAMTRLGFYKKEAAHGSE